MTEFSALRHETDEYEFEDDDDYMECDWCGALIYGGDEYHNVDGDMVCEACYLETM